MFHCTNSNREQKSGRGPTVTKTKDYRYITIIEIWIWPFSTNEYVNRKEKNTPTDKKEK